MAAHVFAPAACLGGADRSLRTVRHVEFGVPIQRKQTATVGHKKVKARNLARARALWIRGKGRRCRETLRNGGQFFLELTPEHVVDTKGAEPIGVERRIQSIRANASRSIEPPHFRDGGTRQSRGRVHRQVKTDERCRANRVLVQPFLRQVKTRDLPTRSS